MQSVHRAGHLARCTSQLMWQEVHIWGAAGPQTRSCSIPTAPQELTALSPSQWQAACHWWGVSCPMGLLDLCLRWDLHSAAPARHCSCPTPACRCCWRLSSGGAGTSALSWAWNFQLPYALDVAWRLLCPYLPAHLHSQLPLVTFSGARETWTIQVT